MFYSVRHLVLLRCTNLPSRGLVKGSSLWSIDSNYNEWFCVFVRMTKIEFVSRGRLRRGWLHGVVSVTVHVNTLSDNWWRLGREVILVERDLQSLIWFGVPSAVVLGESPTYGLFVTDFRGEPLTGSCKSRSVSTGPLALQNKTMKFVSRQGERENVRDLSVCDLNLSLFNERLGFWPKQMRGSRHFRTVYENEETLSHRRRSFNLWTRWIRDSRLCLY